jgi:Flp pilus assembly protein TadD
MGRLRRIWACGFVAAGLAAPLGGARASLFHEHQPKAAMLSDAAVAEIRRAIDEQRYLDAGQALDEAVVENIQDPRLHLLIGELSLARGHAESALSEFQAVESAPVAHAEALEGEGIAQAALGRSEDAFKTLQKAVAANPNAWRAWNAMGCLYDERRDWTHSADAYAHALAVPGSGAIVLNNRGYSHLLQNKLDDAETDFVAALTQRPDLAAARTNLRLTLALKGQFDRATAGGGKDDQAALLNNAGFAALVQGDFARAASCSARR